MKKKLSVICFLILAISVCISCLKKDEPVTEQADKGLVLILDSEPKTLDPAFLTGVIGIRVAAGLFEGLTVYNEETLEPEPGIAESWTVSDDGKVYTFKLRESVWSNGDPVTADDFIWACNHIDQIDSKHCRDYATANFSMEVIGRMYEEYFVKVQDVFLSRGGWYAEHPERVNLDWLKRH